MSKKLLGYEMDRKGKKRGRSQELICSRNECLVARYYFLSEIKRLRFDDVIARLSCAFFISHSQVMSVITKNNNLFEELKGSTCRQISKRWPDYNWE